MPNSTGITGGAVDVVTRLLDATNAHDLTSLTACFAADYINDTPAHPFRSFTGREQVRANWERLFASIPDLRGSIMGMVVDSSGTGSSIAGDVAWTEWRMTGTRPDESAHEMAGVILFTIRDAEIVHGTFFLEPVERGSGTVADNIRRVTVTPTQESRVTP
jgi:ketosteroid isomerase-like protein